MRYSAMLSVHDTKRPHDAQCRQVLRLTHQLDDIQYIAYRLLKFKYLLPMNRKIRLLPMNAIKMPKSLHLVAKLMPKGS